MTQPQPGGAANVQQGSHGGAYDNQAAFSQAAHGAQQPSAGQPFNPEQPQYANPPANAGKSGKGAKIAIIAVIAVVFIAAAVVAVMFLLPKVSSAPGSADASSASASASAEASGPIAPARMLALDDEKLVEALEDEGYEHTSKSSLEVYTKGDIEVEIDAKGGYRTITIAEGTEAYDLLKDEGSTFSQLGKYHHSSAGDYAVGVCKGEDGDCLVIAGNNIVLEILPGPCSS